MSQPKTITADATSGILAFEGVWSTGGSDARDPNNSKYDQVTFASTRANNSRVSFNFTGFEVTIYGGYRMDYGRYQVYLDNIPQGPYRTEANDAPISKDTQKFQQSMFYWSGEEGVHSVTLENLSFPNQTNPANRKVNLTKVDIDYVKWAFNAENAEDVKIQEDDSRFFYSDSSWNKTDDKLFDMGSGSGSVQNGASVNVTFAGDRISLYGPRGPTHASYTVRLDDQPSIIYNANLLPNAKLTGNQLLHSASGLGTAKNHSLVVTSMQNQPGDELSIDYMVVDGIMNKVATTSSNSNGTGGVSSSTSSPQGSANDRRPSGGTLAAIVVGGIACMLLIALLLFCLLRRRLRKRNPSTSETGGINESCPSLTPFNVDETQTAPNPIGHKPGLPPDLIQPPLYSTIVHSAAYQPGRREDYAVINERKRQFDRPLRPVSC